MNKIKPDHVFVHDVYLYVIDTEGRIWRRSMTGGKWTQQGELPDDVDDKVSVSAVDINMG